MTPPWVVELVRLLESPDQDDWPRALKLKTEHLPKHLYRYRAPNECAVESLASGTIWLSAPSAFNDPYDSSLSADAAEFINTLLHRNLTSPDSGVDPSLAARILAYNDPLSGLDQVFVAEVEKESGVDAAVRAQHFFRNFLRGQFGGMATQFTELFQRGLKVACFSETGTSLTLWSYYAESHRGFCLEYAVQGRPTTDPRVRMLMPVVYSSDRFSLTGMLARAAATGAPSIFAATLAAMHKAADWAHEREWRICNPDGSDTPGIAIPMWDPSRVLLGANMPPEFRAKVTAVATARGIPVVQMTLAHGQFALEPQ